MATRHIAPRPVARRDWIQPTPVRRKRRFRWIRRLFLFLVFALIATVLSAAYVQQVYVPGLRSEASAVPALVRAQLQQQNAPYVTSANIAPQLRRAIVAIEDRRFYSHPGVDPVGTIRAVWVNVTNQHVDQGGSTLEQQLVKRAIVHNDRTMRAKLRAGALAWAVDQEFSKSQIIELYLNAAYFGRGAYGAQSAARIYFGRDAASLDLAQAAFLAAMPQAPSIYGADPTSSLVLGRVDTVLRDMRSSGYITPVDEIAAASEVQHLHFAFLNG